MPASSVLHILRTIKERGSISRTDLQQITHLSWGTITNTTRELLQRNLIREEGAVSTKAGRKPVHLALNPAGHSLVGVEIAPDRVRCLMMNLAGETLSSAQFPIDGDQPPQDVLERIVAMVREALSADEKRACLGVGIASAGTLDIRLGIIRLATHLPAWRDVPVLDTLQARLNTTVRLEHKRNCLALAERWFGEASHAENLLCIHLGDTVGLGALVEGEIFRGSEGLAGDFGHTTLDPEGPACSCGDRGCVEAYGSASAVLARAEAVAGQDNSAQKVHTVEELAAQADGGNRAAREAFEWMGRHLGIGAANLIDLFNPDLLVLAGPTTRAREHFLPALIKEMEAHAGRQSKREIIVSRLGELATAMGACGMILQSAFALNNHAGAHASPTAIGA